MPGPQEPNEIYVDVDTGNQQVYLGLFVIAALVGIYLYNKNTESEQTNLRSSLELENIKKEVSRLANEKNKLEAQIQLKVNELNQLNSNYIECGTKLQEASQSATTCATNLSRQTLEMQKLMGMRAVQYNYRSV